MRVVASMFPVRSWKLTPKMLQRTLYLPRKSSQAWETASKVVATPWLQKTSQRLRGSMDFLSMEMVKPRTISFRNPYLRSADHSAERWNFSYTFSNLAGHGSFLLLALSYLEKDFLHLRLFAASGMSLSIIFQYYRLKPLWIPIRWNILFLLINTSMVAALLMERAEADHMSPDEKVLYTTFFERRGMKRVDFSHLMAKAEKKHLKKGTKIATEGSINDHVHLIFSGHMGVVKQHHFIARLGTNQFVGEMSFLRWQHKYNIWKYEQKNAKSPVNLKNVLIELEFEIEDESEEANKSRTTSNRASERKDNNEALEMAGKSTINGNLNSANLTADGNPVAALEGSRAFMKEGETCFADVTCLDDCVAYSWSFEDLHGILEKEPSVAVVFEGLMSFNMTEKFFYSPNTEDSLVNINKGKVIPINDDGSVAPKTGQEETLVKGANEGKDKTK